MRSSRLYLLLLTALLLWAAGTQHRVRQLEAELERLYPTIARIDSGYQGATHDIERHLGVLETTSARSRVELEGAIFRTTELVDAYAQEMRVKDASVVAQATAAHAELATLRRRVAPDADALHDALLAPTVQLSGDGTVGSGTLIWSGYNPRSGTNESYVLTAHHVARNILAEDRAQQDGITLTVYTRNDKVVVHGDMVAHAEEIDAALVKLRTTQRWSTVARVLTKPKAKLVRVSDPIYAVGCPLGNDPILTRGEISSLTNAIRDANYWMLTAPTYFGNSGGGIYLADTLQLIGIFSKVYTNGQSTVVSHMGLCIPIDSVHEWLESEGFAFVLEPAPREETRPTTLEARLNETSRADAVLSVR